MSGHRSRSLIRSLFEWSAIVLLTVLVGEGVARIAGVRPLTAADELWRNHPRWGWHHEPNSTDVFVKTDFTQEIHINSRGLREREFPYEKPAGTRRILVIGDSSVAGFEVKEEERFTRVLERELAARGLRYEVINAGTRGWGTDQSLLFLQEEGLRYQPDIVIYLWCDNDLFDNATIHRPYRRYGKPWMVPAEDGTVTPRGIPVPEYAYRSNLRVGEDGEPLELPVAFRKQAVLWLRDVVVCRSAFATFLVDLAIRVDSLSKGVQNAGSYGDATDGPAKTGGESHVFRATTGMLRAMDRSSRAAGARFVLALADTGAGAMRDAAGIPAIDDLKRFQARIRPGMDLYVKNDPHMNALGHELYGQALAETLVAAGYVGDPAVAAVPKP